MADDRRFRALVRQLRRRLPPLLPVRVYLRERLPGNYDGDTWLATTDGKPDHFVVAVRRGWWVPTRDALVHEWAHAISWCDGHPDLEDHGPEWGLAHARVYSCAVALKLW